MWHKLIDFLLKTNFETEYADVEYRGQSGFTSSCLEALAELLQGDRNIDEAWVISFKRDEYFSQHCFMFLALGKPKFVVRDGFSSGYFGEGPKGFTVAIGMIRSFNFKLKEKMVSENLFKKVAGSGLVNADIEALKQLHSNHLSKILQYMEESYTPNPEHLFWEGMPVTLPLPIIDTRLLDIAKTFWKDPDGGLHKGFRRLEDIVRHRTGLDLHGAKLFSQVFLGESARLEWRDRKKETPGLAQLFTGTYAGFRNTRAHKEENTFDAKSLALEFLQLNQLYVLEREAIDVTQTK